MKDAELVRLEKPDLSKASSRAIAVALSYDKLSLYGQKLIDFIIKQEREIADREAIFKRYGDSFEEI